MTILLHAHYEETEEERQLIGARALELLTTGKSVASAESAAVEEFIDRHLPNNVHLVLAEELA